MDEDFKLTGFRKWHEPQLQVDGSVKDLLKVRFWLGSHGPFEVALPRDASDSDVGAAIARERQSLRTLSTY